MPDSFFAFVYLLFYCRLQILPLVTRPARTRRTHPAESTSVQGLQWVDPVKTIKSTQYTHRLKLSLKQHNKLAGISEVPVEQ